LYGASILCLCEDFLFSVIARSDSDEAIQMRNELRFAPNEQRQFTERKIPLYPPFPKGEDLNSLLCKRRAGEDFKELFIPSMTPPPDRDRGSQ
jgi:hypothetical protein